MGDGQARMTPLAFEALYRAEWQELEEHLDCVLKRTSKPPKEPLRGERIARSTGARASISRSHGRDRIRRICSIASTA